MSGFLDRMATGSRERADAAIALEPLPVLRARCRDLAPPPDVRVVDSARATAIALKELLAESGMAATGGPGRIRFYATDHPDGFRAQGERFLDRPLRAVQLLAIDELEGYRR